MDVRPDKGVFYYKEYDVKCSTNNHSFRTFLNMFLSLLVYRSWFLDYLKLWSLVSIVTEESNLKGCIEYVHLNTL